MMIDWKDEWKRLALYVVIFIACFYLPVGMERFDSALMEAFHLVKWYAREHVILCLIPAFFIAGAIAVFLSQASVMKYLGARANKLIAYSVASVSGSVLAVCSCTILPLFSGIYRMGAGLGPASTFLYSGPAINVLAIILTARILGLEIGAARAIGAIAFSIVIGLCMSILFRKEQEQRADAQEMAVVAEVSRPLWQNILYFAALIAILVFANWGKPQGDAGLWAAIYAAKWSITAIAGAALGLFLFLWLKIAWWKLSLAGLAVIVASVLAPQQPMIPFSIAFIASSIILSHAQGEGGEWLGASWDFARQILPLLFAGVLVAGLLLGRPGQEGLIPSSWVSGLVGGNSLAANLFASVIGAFMYFATLTEIPILQGLIGAGMGKGPALALLLAGPAVSLPNMLVIRSVLGTKKTVIFMLLVIVLSTLAGLIYGNM